MDTDLFEMEKNIAAEPQLELLFYPKNNANQNFIFVELTSFYKYVLVSVRVQIRQCLCVADCYAV